MQKNESRRRGMWRSVRAVFHRRWLRQANRRHNLREIDERIARLQKLKQDQEGLGRSGLLIGF